MAKKRGYPYVHVYPYGCKVTSSSPQSGEKDADASLRASEGKKEMKVETSVKLTDISFYYPSESKLKKLPLYINFHGGAFIMHEKEMDDPYCRYLANRTACIIANVEYAKAPEYPFPNALEQVYEVFRWIQSRADDLNIDTEKMMVGGQSSGANLAAALCLYLEEKRKSNRCFKCCHARCWILRLLMPTSRKRTNGGHDIPRPLTF